MFVWRVKFFGAWLAGCIAVVIAAMHGFELVSHLLASQTAISIAANIYIAVLSAAVVIIAAARQWLTIRKERYANIAPILHQIMHEVRDADTFIQMKEPREGTRDDYGTFSNNCKIIFGRILDQLNTIFSSLTSTHCRTSIKLLYGTQELYVYTLARDQGSHQKCYRTDNNRVRNNHDPLQDNFQFARLFNDNEECWHFMSNDLTCDESFRSTSVTAYSPDHARRAPILRAHWYSLPALRQKWPLPYRSTITCVIRQGPFDLVHDLRPEVLGFLTVDSESRGVFEERWDAQIMFAVADALYPVIRAYLDAQNRAPP